MSAVRRLLRPLDRYVFVEFWKIFVTTALGFPLLVILFDLTDHLGDYLARSLTLEQIALSYLYWLPDSMFLVLPAAVLFATVFTIGGLTRHSEITAAKASGLSFHRVVRPIFAGAVVVAMLGLVLAELVPVTNARRNAILQERKFKSTQRFNFAYASERGRVYKASALNAETGVIDGLQIERKGGGPDYPTYLMTAATARWTAARGWKLERGGVHIIPDSTTDIAFSFDSLRDRNLRERPPDLLASPKSPQEMRYRELSRFIAALERSGGDVNELKVERALKIAIPITCIIIALFGAPLATSTQRGGAAYGIGVSLVTTVVFLMLIQMTKAIGQKGLIFPDVAAWIPNIVFGIGGLWLLTRVRT
jgi:lipopolysaccharide export system permease protein